MIQINLMSDADRNRVRAIIDFYLRPFSLRHPDQKKVKCHQCKTKMTVEELRNHTHVIKFEVDFGSSMFKGKRFHPHYSRRALLLVERVRKLMPEASDNLPVSEFQKAIKLVKTIASRQLRKEWKAEAKQKRDQQKLSRRINRV